MRTLVVLAVIGVCSASYQAPIVHPRYTGPVAATVPAGVDGQIVQVPDTHEVMAARNKFFATYNEQLARVNSHPTSPSYSAPAPVTNNYPSYAPATSYPAPAPSYPSHSGPPGPAYRAPGYPFNDQDEPRPVGDTADVASAKASFLNSYNRKVAEAAAAPDVYIITGSPAPLPVSYAPAPISNNYPHSAPAPSYAPGPSYTQHSGPPGPAYRAPGFPFNNQDEPRPVGDTAEVAAAKGQFFSTYNRQAAEAAAAPDHYATHSY
ncbi:hypothetical protein Pmani_011084 [Petrolisthes manimaculis]|uniref:Uncharacterized protein n=1 Tax=Petrolisthes manimaculis TaxID=1843537 RepID=A0AAE1Q1T8_9EUCA|nr:hypothetical protein Pmani_011084 [Petrolisthes manimaculis]